MSGTLRKRIQPRTLYTINDEVGDESEISQTRLEVGSEISGRSIVLEKCELNRTRIIGAPGLRVAESRFDTVDAANAKFDESGWRDADVVESRWTGACMNFSHMARCGFVNCQMGHTQIQESTLKDVRFESCDLRNAYFNRSQMQGTVFGGSNLTGADFSGAEIRGCDFRRAIIEDIRIAPGQLVGVIVTPDQALYLARLLGLDVRE